MGGACWKIHWGISSTGWRILKLRSEQEFESVNCIEMAQNSAKYQSLMNTAVDTQASQKLVKLVTPQQLKCFHGSYAMQLIVESNTYALQELLNKCVMHLNICT